MIVLNAAVFECRTMERHRHGVRGEEFDYPPMDPGSFSPSPHPPPWLEPPPPYEVAIKTTCSSTHLRRSYSDTHLATEPLFGRSREISFEVWHWTGGRRGGASHLSSVPKINRHKTGASAQTLRLLPFDINSSSYLKHVFFLKLTCAHPCMSLDFQCRCKYIAYMVKLPVDHTEFSLIRQK